MFNKNSHDDFEDLRRQEAYERQKSINLARGLGNFFYRYMVFSLIVFVGAITIGLTLNLIANVNLELGIPLGMLFSFFIFKIRYVKDYPIKSLLTLSFICFIMFTAVS